jgi:hypothetical protein
MAAQAAAIGARLACGRGGTCDRAARLARRAAVVPQGVGPRVTPEGPPRTALQVRVRENRRGGGRAVHASRTATLISHRPALQHLVPRAALTPATPCLAGRRVSAGDGAYPLLATGQVVPSQRLNVSAGTALSAALLWTRSAKARKAGSEAALSGSSTAPRAQYGVHSPVIHWRAYPTSAPLRLRAAQRQRVPAKTSSQRSVVVRQL